MHLHVRAENVARLKRLAALTGDQFAEILDVLENKVSTLAATEALLEAARGMTLSAPAEAMAIAEATFPLLFTYVADGEKPADVVSAVLRSLRSDKSVAAKDIGVLKGRLAAIVGSKVLALKAKGAALVMTRGNLLTGAKIITDVRPVFGAQAASSIDAFTVIHTLVLDVSENGMQKAIHVAIDRADLDALKKAIDRAEIKDKAISRWIDRTGVTRIRVD
jgi:hypothetical protein